MFWYFDCNSYFITQQLNMTEFVIYYLFYLLAYSYIKLLKNFVLLITIIYSGII